MYLELFKLNRPNVLQLSELDPINGYFRCKYLNLCMLFIVILQDILGLKSGI